MKDEDKVRVLQRFIDGFPTDLQAVQAAITGAPEPAARLLVGALNYALDMLDLFPDHHKGVGIADDAIVLRVAAKLAVTAGLANEAVEALAQDAKDIAGIFGDLTGPLEKLVSQLPDREVRGRTAAKILSHKDTKVMFDADVTREAKKQKPQIIDAESRAVIELRKMLEAGLKRAGVM